MSTLSRRSILSMTAVGAVGGLLTACSKNSTAPAVNPGPSASAPAAALSEERLNTVLAEFNEALKKADEKKDAALLAPRISGSAAEFRKASYEIMKKAGDDLLKADPGNAPTLDRPAADPTVPVTTAADTFPRYALVVAKDEKGDDPKSLPFFVGFEQKDAKSPYTSWGWARQAAGVPMPTVSPAVEGSAPVPKDADDLLLKPQDAIALYTKVLTDGHENADKKDLMAPDPFQKGVHAEIQAERSQINTGVAKDEVATIREEYTPHKSDYLGLRTVDGGAIVMTTLMSKRTLTVKSGKVTVGKETVSTKLAGTKTFTKNMVREYGNTVVLHIPPKDAKGAKVQPIAGYKVMVKASGS